MLFIFAAFPVNAADGDAPADVRVVIDVSGSMKQNDPNNLRRPALELLVKLLPDGSKAGVWTFGRYVNMLVPHREVNSQWRDTANEKASEINSTGLYTNIGEALEKAAYDLNRSNDDYRTSLILLTDGMVDISREPDENQREWRRIVDELLPKFAESNVTIHTIALSENADLELLNKLALSTDGISAVAETAEELLKIFLEAFDRAAPAEQLPLENNSFVVDSSVEEFTALIFRESDSSSTQLISPEQEQYSFDKESEYVNWYRTEAYDLITVNKPIEGEWLVRADLNPDSRVTVVSNLNLVVKPIKNNLYIDDSAMLSLLLREDGSTITRREFLELLDISYQVERRKDSKLWRGVLSDSSKPRDRDDNFVPPNGIYEAPLDMFGSEGYYHIQVLVDGKSFQREFSHTVAVRQLFDVKQEKEIDGADTHHFITVSSYSSDLDLQNTKVVARVKDPRGRGSIKPLLLTDSDNWLLDLKMEFEGQYEVVLRVDAVDTQGGEFEFSPPTIEIQYPDSDDPFAATSVTNSEPPLTEPAPEPQPIEFPEPEIEVESQSTGETETIEPEPETAPETIPDSEPQQSAEEPSDNKLWLYVGLGVGNFLIIILAFVAYRMIMSKKDETDLGELESAVAEANSTVEAKGKPPATPPPSMADVEPDTDDDVDVGSGELADSLMAEDLDIATEEPPPAKNQGEPPPLDPGDEVDDGEKEDLGVSDVEFSLDDFSSDDLDDDDN